MRVLAAGLKLFRFHSRAEYRRTMFGMVWLVLPSVLIALAALYVRARGHFSVETPGMSYGLFVAVGFLAWQGFVDAIYAPLQFFQRYTPLLTRTTVRLEIILAAAMFSSLSSGAIRFAVAMAAMLVAKEAALGWLWYAALAWTALVVFGFGIGLFLTPLALLRDDVKRALGLMLMFWLFLSPVFYPISVGPLDLVNPVAVLLPQIRSAAIGTAPGDIGTVYSGLAVILAAAGWFVLRSVRPRLAAGLE